MSEIMLPVSGHGYVRVVLKQIFTFEGIGVTRFMFTFELSNKARNSTGFPLWLGGRVEVQARGGNRPYVGPLQPATAQPIDIGPFGQDTSAQLTLDVTDRQFWLIDENRVSGAVQVYLNFTGYALVDGQHVAITEQQQLNHQISQSDWLDLVRRAGLRRVLLLELETPDPQAHPDLAEALDYFAKARSRYGDGDWPGTVESIRQSLAALVGKKAEEEDQESDITEAVKAAYKDSREGRIGYAPRQELVRRAAKFMADLGAHPEVAQTQKPDAYAALMIAGGLLHVYSLRAA